VAPDELHSFVGFMKALFRRTMADKVPVLAAALSFFTMLSIVPVLILALAILGFAIYTAGGTLQNAAHLAVVDLQQAISRVLPGANAQKTFYSLAQQINLEQSLIKVIAARGIAAITGALTLTWAALQIFVNASGLMNLAFDVDETRSWIKLRLVCLGVLLGASVLFLLSLIPTSGPDFVRNLHIPWLGVPNPVPWWVDTIFALLALAVNVAMFAFIYKFLPNAKVEWKDAAIGGLAMGVLWEIAKKGFALFLANSNNPMYGALGGVILLVTWMYYTNVLLLLGAEVSGLYRKVRVGAEEPDLAQQRFDELHAVHQGTAVPLPAGAMAASQEPPLAESRKRMRDTMDRIRDDVHGMRESVRSAAHAVKTTPARHSAARAFDETPSAEDRQDMDVASTAEERRPPEKMPRREIFGALGGATPAAKATNPETQSRRQEDRAIEERAACAMREGDYPPAKVSKERAKETVNEIRSHVLAMGESVRRAREQVAEDV
jgi:membrane protein